MSADILDFHKNPKANAAWSNMERLHLMRKQGLLPEVEMPCDVNPFDADLSFEHQGGDVA